MWENCSSEREVCVTSDKKAAKTKWRESMRRCLERLRAIKVVLDLTPQSDQDHDLSFNYDNEAAAEVPVDLPTQSRPKRKKSSVMKELRKLKKLNEKLTKQLEAKKKRAERFRKRNQRRHVNKNTHSNTEKQSKRRIAQERKSQVESFLLRDESSRLLPGKRDTVGRKQKMQNWD